MKQKRNIKSTLQNAESATYENPKKKTLAFQCIVHELEPEFSTKKNEFIWDKIFRFAVHNKCIKNVSEKEKN